MNRTVEMHDAVRFEDPRSRSNSEEMLYYFYINCFSGNTEQQRIVFFQGAERFPVRDVSHRVGDDHGTCLISLLLGKW